MNLHLFSNNISEALVCPICRKIVDAPLAVPHPDGCEHHHQCCMLGVLGAVAGRFREVSVLLSPSYGKAAVSASAVSPVSAIQPPQALRQLAKGLQRNRISRETPGSCWPVPIRSPPTPPRADLVRDKKA